MKKQLLIALIATNLTGMMMASAEIPSKEQQKVNDRAEWAARAVHGYFQDTSQWNKLVRNVLGGASAVFVVGAACTNKPETRDSLLSSAALTGVIAVWAHLDHALAQGRIDEFPKE